jgi:uncharacterized protein YceH (UPF0502 family)
MLRGPQTVGELHARTERLHRFEGLRAVQTELEALATHDPPLTVRLERRPGQKDARWTHRLGGTPAAAAAPTDDEASADDETEVDTAGRPATIAAPPPVAQAPDGLAEEVRALRQEVRELHAVVDQLREALGD